jgi:hypothetical protein
MPRCDLAEVLTVDMRSGALDEIMVVLHPTVLTVVLVHATMLTMMFCPL